MASAKKVTAKTPAAQANADLELASGAAAAIISEMAQAFKQGNAFTEAGHQFGSDINVPELLSLDTGIVGTSVTALKVVSDATLALRQINAASQDNMVNQATGLATILANFDAVDQASFGRDKRWNLDEQPAWFAILADRIADTLVKDDPDTAVKIFGKALAARMAEVK